MFCHEHGTVDYCPECDESEKDKRIAELEAQVVELRQAGDYEDRFNAIYPLIAENAKLKAKLARHRTANSNLITANDQQQATIARLEATIAEQKKVIDAQEAYIRLPFPEEAARMGTAKRNLADLIKEEE